jgi:hypothetical protein
VIANRASFEPGADGIRALQTASTLFVMLSEVEASVASCSGLPCATAWRKIPTMKLPALSRRIWKIGAGIVAALLVILLVVQLAFGFIVSSSVMTAWIKSQIDSQSNGRLVFNGAGGSIFSIKLNDVTFEPAAAWNVNITKAPALYARISLPALLGRNLVLKEITLEDADVDVSLDGSGAEHIGFPLPVPALALRHSTLKINNLAGWRAVFEDCKLDATQSGKRQDLTVSGRLRSGKATIGPLTLTSVDATFTMAKGILKVSDVSATLAGGDVALSGEWKLPPVEKLQNVELNLKGASIQPLLSQLGYGDNLGGTTDLKLKVEGVFSPASKSLGGQGTVEFEKVTGRVNVPHIPLLGDNLFEKASNLNGNKGLISFVMRGPSIVLTSIRSESDSAITQGRGNLDYNGTIQASLSAALKPATAKLLPPMAGTIFKKDAAGDPIVPFTLSGTPAQLNVEIESVAGGVILSPIKGIFGD